MPCRSSAMQKEIRVLGQLSFYWLSVHLPYLCYPSTPTSGDPPGEPAQIGPSSKMQLLQKGHGSAAHTAGGKQAWAASWDCCANTKPFCSTTSWKPWRLSSEMALIWHLCFIFLLFTQRYHSSKLSHISVSNPFLLLRPRGDGLHPGLAGTRGKTPLTVCLIWSSLKFLASRSQAQRAPTLDRQDSKGDISFQNSQNPTWWLQHPRTAHHPRCCGYSILVC